KRLETAQPSLPVRLKILRPARPANEPLARSRLQSDVETDALPEVLRHVSSRDQEYVERGGDRFSNRLGPYAAPHERRGSPPHRAPGGFFRHRRFHRGE